MSSTGAGRLHDSGDSSVKRCQECGSGVPSADGSTLALMSSLSAPASGAPCGTRIIKMADKKNCSSKKSQTEREGAQSGTKGIALPTEGNHPVGKDQYKKRKGKDLEKISVYASFGQLSDSHFGWVAL